jgi:hypothetical protein
MRRPGRVETDDGADYREIREELAADPAGRHTLDRLTSAGVARQPRLPL